VVYTITDPYIKEFLDSIERTTTKKCYKTFLKLYLDWSGKTGQQLIDEKKAHPDDGYVEKSLLQFRKWITDSGKSSNYARSVMGAVGGFFHYYRVKLNFTTSESRRLLARERTTSDYRFEKEDFERIGKYASLREKYILYVGKAVGLRASDFLLFTFGHFRSAKLDGEPPVFLGEFATHKQSEKVYPFLDSDALSVVKDLLEVNKAKLDSDRVLDDSEDNLSLILQNLCRKSGMEIIGTTIHGKRVRFHCMRKFLSERLSVYSAESQWKQIVGKAISEGAYISPDQLKVVYSKAMKDISVNGNGVKAKKLVELEAALIDSQKQQYTLNTTVEVMRKELMRLSQKVDFFDKYIGLSDVVQTEDDYKHVSDFFEKLRLEKEIEERKQSQP
jgi:hypothetical protein